jgi:hypothetical protein
MFIRNISCVFKSNIPLDGQEVSRTPPVILYITKRRDDGQISLIMGWSPYSSGLQGPLLLVNLRAFKLSEMNLRVSAWSDSSDRKGYLCVCPTVRGHFEARSALEPPARVQGPTEPSN